MKIFSLRPLSNYDRIANLLDVMKRIQVNPSGTNKYGVDIKVDTKYYTQDFDFGSFKKFSQQQISKIVANLRSHHG